MSKCLRKAAAAFLAALFCVLSVPAGAMLPAQAADSKWGLHVEADGRVTLGGSEFYAMGLNMWDGFNRIFADHFYIDPATSFQTLSKNGIPFVRTAFCGYYPSQIRMYLDDPEAYFEKMDDYVETAERYHVGIIAVFFWTHFSVSDVVGESVGKIGDSASKTMAYAKKYVQDVVTRYKDSPAIWGWEIGNEYNLAADLGTDNLPPVVTQFGTPGTRSEKDRVTADDVRVFYREIAAEVRKYDSYRLISNGDADYRAAQYHLWFSQNWEQDSRQELEIMMGTFSPGDIDTISVHIYELEQKRFGKDMTLEDLLPVYAEIARTKKKALYFGEFGAKDDAAMVRQIEAIKKCGIQISSPWNFDEVGMAHSSFSNTGWGSHIFTRAAELNRHYRDQKLQSSEAMWQKAGTKNTKKQAWSDSLVDLTLDIEAKTLYVQPALTVSQLCSALFASDGCTIQIVDAQGGEVPQTAKLTDSMTLKAQKSGNTQAFSIRIAGFEPMASVESMEPVAADRSQGKAGGEGWRIWAPWVFVMIAVAAAALLLLLALRKKRMGTKS